MKWLPSTALAALLLLAAGCSTPVAAPPIAAPSAVAPQGGEAWRSEATAQGVARIDGLGAVWAQALANARKAGFGRRIGAEGDLLRPEAALPRPAPTPGPYACRVLRLGTTGTGSRAYSAGRPGFCYVGAEGEGLSLSTETPPLRAGGYLWDDSVKRLVFLGAVAPGRSGRPPAYSTDPVRDVVGVFERIGDFRFRLVVHWPGEAELVVFELVAAPRG